MMNRLIPITAYFVVTIVLIVIFIIKNIKESRRLKDSI